MHPRPSRNRKVPARYLENSCSSPDVTQPGGKRSFEEGGEDGKENQMEIKYPNGGSLAKRGRKSSSRGATGRLNIREPLVKVLPMDEEYNDEDDIVVVDELGQGFVEVKVESGNEPTVEVTFDFHEYATPPILRSPTGLDHRDCSEDKSSGPGSIEAYGVDGDGETSSGTTANGCNNGTYVEEKSDVSNLANLTMDNINDMSTQDIWDNESMETKGSSSSPGEPTAQDDLPLVSDPIKVCRKLDFECTRHQPIVVTNEHNANMTGTGANDVRKKKFKGYPVPSTPEVFDQVEDDCVPLKIFAHADDEHAQTDADTTWTLVVIGPKVVPFLQKKNSSFSQLFPEIVQVTHISKGCFVFRTNLKTLEHEKCPVDIVHKLSRDYVIDATEPVHLMDSYMSTLPQIVFTR